MKTRLCLAFVLAVGAAVAIVDLASAALFTPGNLVVYRVAGTTNAATAVFVDEYTTTGTLVQSIAMPTTTSGSQNALTASATATAEGYLNLSADGQYVTLTGYGAATGTLSIATTTAAVAPRVIGRIDFAGNVDTSTSLGTAASSSDYSGQSIRSAITTNGTDLWVSGVAGGVRYTTFGSTTTSTGLSTVQTTVRALEAYGGQLTVGSTSGIHQVGTGMPTTSGQTMNVPAGLTPTSPYGHFLADLDAMVAGLDTAYVADDGTTGGIRKFSLVGGTWTANGTLGVDADDYRGLTGRVTAGGVQLYATKQSGSGTTQGIYSLLDASGYGATITGTLTQIAVKPTGSNFRGIDFAPVAVIPEASAFLCVGLAGVLIGLGRKLFARQAA